MEEAITTNEEISEGEDLILSDTDDAPSLDKGVTLNIDSNGRIVTDEGKCENDGDDCDMHFVAKNFLGYRSSDAGFHTSTEELNVSDEEEKPPTALTLQSVNLDGIASTSKAKNISLSTLNYSHTLLKDGSLTDAEYMSDDEASTNVKEIFVNKNKQIFPPGLTIKGLSPTSSLILPSQRPLNSLNIKNAYADSLLLDEDMHDLEDEQESLPMTCLEFLKAEISDGNNTDAEDISVGSLEDVGEISRKDKNPLENGYFPGNPLLLADSNKCKLGKDERLSHPGNSRRSSTAEFHTEDEIFSLENFSNRCQKRVKKRSLITADRGNASDGSATDEEII